MFRVACVLTSDRNNIYLLFLSIDCSPIQAVLLGPTVLIVSIGRTPLSVALATTNFPALPSAWFTAFQPPNSVISFTFPASTPVVAPTPSILLIFVLFWIALGNCSSFSFNSSSPALACGAMYTWFAASSLVVSVVELGSAARLLRFLGLFPSEDAVATSIAFLASSFAAAFSASESLSLASITFSFSASVNSFLSRVSTFWGADSGEGLFSTVEGWVFVSTVAAGLVATVFPS